MPENADGPVLFCPDSCRVALVRFGLVTVRAWDGLSGSGFSVLTLPLWKGVVLSQYSFNRKSRFRFLLVKNGSDCSGSSSGFWRNGSDLPVSGFGLVAGPSCSYCLRTSLSCTTWLQLTKVDSNWQTLINIDKSQTKTDYIFQRRRETSINID